MIFNTVVAIPKVIAGILIVYGTRSGKSNASALAAWAENSIPQQQSQEEMKSFSLDWSDEERDSEDELEPMHINLNQRKWWRES